MNMTVNSIFWCNAVLIAVALATTTAGCAPDGLPTPIPSQHAMLSALSGDGTPEARPFRAWGFRLLQASHATIS
jgi:hypothetical protein